LHDQPYDLKTMKCYPKKSGCFFLYISYIKGKTGEIMFLSYPAVIIFLSFSYFSLSCMQPGRLIVKGDYVDSRHYLAVYQREVNSLNEMRSNTPLHVAAYFGQSSVLNYLLVSGAVLDAKNKKGFTALHYAANKGHEDAVAILLAHGAEPNRKAKNGKRPLHLAAILGRNNIIRQLLDGGANPDVRDKKKRTPMYLAIANNFPDTVNLLVQRGANPRVRARNGLLPIDICTNALAMFFRNLDVLATQLHNAVRNHDHKTISHLLAQGTPINAQNEEGNTPLHTAVLSGNYPTLYTLLIHGADPTIENKDGQTPVHLAVQYNFITPGNTTNAYFLYKGIYHYSTTTMESSLLK